MINTYYILEKFSTKTNARDAVKILIKCCNITTASIDLIQIAINSNFNDFEDAVQYFCAKNVDSELLVTNNKKDFKASEIKTLTAKEAFQFLLEQQ